VNENKTVPSREPVRQCSACFTHRTKKELIRLTKGSDGVEIDAAQKNQSRGIYLCPDEKCIKKLIKTGRIKSRFGIFDDRELEERLLACIKEKNRNGNS